MDTGANTLVVASSEKSRNVLSELLRLDGFLTLASVSSGSEARRLLLECGFDMVIVNTPLSDEFGDGLAVLSAERASGVILLVNSDIADRVSAKVEDAGVFVLEKPLNRQIFFQAVRLVWAARRRMPGLKNENGRLQEKIEEIRQIDRAKCVLIEVLHMTEPQAHRFIEKQAMDLRLSRNEVAKNILKTYER